MSKKDGTKNCKCGETNLEMFYPTNHSTCKKCLLANKVKKTNERANNPDTIYSCKCGETDKLNFRKNRFTECKSCINEKAKLYRQLNHKHKDHLCKVCGETDNTKFHKAYFNLCKSCRKIEDYDRRQNYDSDENTKYECNVCGETDKSKFTKIKPYKCNSCLTTIERLKIAEEKIANGNNGDDSIFYVLAFTAKDDSSISFFKYGITELDIKRRFRGYKYNIDIIKLYYGDKDFIDAVEYSVLKKTEDLLYSLPEGHRFYPTVDTISREIRTKIDLDLVENVIEEQNIILERLSGEENLEKRLEAFWLKFYSNNV